MAGRKTTTGSVLEQMILPALERGGYRFEEQVNIGARLGGGRHKVDVVARNSAGKQFLISLKWQQTSGTAEQKVPFEVICLAEAMNLSPNTYECAYVVLGGRGWKLRDFFTSGGLNRHLAHVESVKILYLEDFVARANNSLL